MSDDTHGIPLKKEEVMYCIVMNLGIVGPFTTGEEAEQHIKKCKKLIPNDPEYNFGRIVRMITPEEDLIGFTNAGNLLGDKDISKWLLEDKEMKRLLGD